MNTTAEDGQGPIILSIDGAVILVTVNRPDVLNAIDATAVQVARDALQSIGAAEQVRVSSSPAPAGGAWRAAIADTLTFFVRLQRWLRRGPDA
jgi:hypothetical protein